MIVLNPLGEWQRGINTFPAWASRLSINCSSVSCSFEVDRPNQEDDCRSPSSAWWRVAVVLFSLPGWLGIQVPEARTLSLLQTELLSMWRALLAARHRGWNSPSWCSSGPQGSVAMVVGLDLWCSLRNLLLFSSWGMRSARRLHKSFYGRSLLFFFQYFSSPSFAILPSPKVAIAGLGPLLNRCTVILFSMICLDGLSLNQRNGRKFWCFGSTWNEWNIWSMWHSDIILTKADYHSNKAIHKVGTRNKFLIEQDPLELGWQIEHHMDLIRFRGMIHPKVR